MSVIVSTFPPIDSMNSSRGWALAIIVLLHLGFIWAFSSGLVQEIVTKERSTQFVPIERPVVERRLPEKPIPTVDDFKPDIFLPQPELNPTQPEERSNTAPEQVTSERVEPPPSGSSQVQEYRVPSVVLPSIDPRVGLSEPPYPASEIRQNHTGTVILSVYVLENGRVGDVKVHQSTGHTRLDEAAVREARKWRFKPGTQDGVPVAMWKQVPITFQLM